VLDLDHVDLEEIVIALDSRDYESRFLISPVTGQITFWTEYGGIDGNNPVDLEELDADLVSIEPLPSWRGYRDMADFAQAVTDERVRERLERALDGKGAFRRFGDEVFQRQEHLAPAWRAFRDVRARRRAVDWLADEGLIAEEEAERFREQHPDPEVP
jgi:hypothetical protein